MPPHFRKIASILRNIAAIGGVVGAIITLINFYGDKPQLVIEKITIPGSLTPDNSDPLVFKIMNTGRQAKIVSSSLIYAIGPFPKNPKFADKSTRISGRLFTAHQEEQLSSGMENPLTKEEAKNILGRKTDLYIYGFIEYKDALLSFLPSQSTIFCVHYAPIEGYSEFQHCRNDQYQMLK